MYNSAICEHRNTGEPLIKGNLCSSCRRNKQNLEGGNMGAPSVNSQALSIPSSKLSAHLMGTKTSLSWIHYCFTPNLARGYFRHRQITRKEKSSATGWALHCPLLIPAFKAGCDFYFFFFSVFSWPKVILPRISAHNTREQSDDKPCDDGHVQVCAALIGQPGHRTIQSPAGSELIISWAFQSE